MPCRQILYNYDRAKNSPFLVVFEGITDVMRFGDCSVAILGKKLKQEQCTLIGATWQRDEPIILCLDPDAIEDSRQAIHQLQQSITNPVLQVYLPGGADPADLDRAALHNIIRSQVAQCGIQLPIAA
jgi:DNA primase